MATGTDVKPRHKFGLFPLTTNCQLKNGEILLFGGDYLRTYSVLEDREDYKAGVAAGREQCAKIIESVAIQFDKDLQAHEPREWDEGYKWKMSDRERSEREPIAIFAIKISKIIRSGE